MSGRAGIGCEAARGGCSGGRVMSRGKSREREREDGGDGLPTTGCEQRTKRLRYVERFLYRRPYRGNRHLWSNRSGKSYLYWSNRSDWLYRHYWSEWHDTCTTQWEWRPSQMRGGKM